MKIQIFIKHIIYLDTLMSGTFFEFEKNEHPSLIPFSCSLMKYWISFKDYWICSGLVGTPRVIFFRCRVLGSSVKIVVHVLVEIGKSNLTAAQWTTEISYAGYKRHKIKKFRRMGLYPLKDLILKEQKFWLTHWYTYLTWSTSREGFRSNGITMW